MPKSHAGWTAWALLTALAFIALPSDSFAGSSAASSSWLDRGGHDRRVHAAVRAHPHKLPLEYVDNLRYVSDDGTIRVMVALARRDPEVEMLVRRHTIRLHWYGDAPRFYAAVDQDGFGALLNNEAVTFVEPDYPLTYFLATSVPFVNARGPRGLWNLESGGIGSLSSNYPGLSTDAATGKGVTVSIVDSGIDKTHRDFGGWDCNPGIYQPCDSRIRRTVALGSVLGSPDVPGDALPTTDFASGHGTHVAGIVAGNGYYARDGEASEGVYGGDGYVIGMAPQASLVSVKLGDTLWAGLGQVALQWTLDHAKELDIRVANNSWGCANGCQFSPNSVLAQIQRDLFELGVVTVFSAGNSGGEGGGGELNGLGQSPYVLSVASYNDETGELSGFSSRGWDFPDVADLADPATWTPQSETRPPRRPDIAAPGHFIDSAANLTGGAASIIPRIDPADLDQQPGVFAYTFMSGTSMAAPHVSGAAALLFSACPSARPLDVMRALMAGATPTIMKTDGSGIAEPFEVGYGGLDVRASLEWMLPRPPCDGTGIGRIEGIVIEGDTASPVKKAHFTCVGLKDAVSDADGRFTIEDVAAQTYRCRTSAKGFAPIHKTITVQHATTKLVELEMNRQKKKRSRAKTS